LHNATQDRSTTFFFLKETKFWNIIVAEPEAVNLQVELDIAEE
jgi:hypothetical protein